MINNLKKVELHVHLDGSLRPETVYELARERHIDLKSPDEAIVKMQCPLNCTSLVEYLKCFDLPLQVLQDEESLERCAYELLADLAKENVLYAEIRYAPLLHLNGGLKPKKVVEAVLRGLERAKEDFQIYYGLLLCCMRHEDDTVNKNVVRLAGDYYGGGVVGLDLAGDEANFSCKRQKAVFEFAKGAKLLYTIHAGEAAGAESIWDALELGAARVGHGINAREDKKLIRYLKERMIALEMCPTSNYQTKAVANLKEHPLHDYHREGLQVVINTDNRTVSQTTLNKEYELVQELFDWKEEDFIRANKMALDASFVDLRTKEMLKNLLLSRN